MMALCLSAWAAGNAVVGTTPTAKPQSRTGNPRSVDAITIPQMLSYQGKLTDTFGLPVADTTYSTNFRLYNVPSGGSPFWNETQVVRTRGGLFSTLLGSVTPIGTVPDVGALYLGMAVGGGAELSPRLRIASAAYAYLTARSADADLLQGRDTTTFSRSTHNHDATYVNEGQASSVTSTMITDATIAAADLGQMGAASGQVMKWTGSAWAPRNDSVGGGAGPVRGSDIVKPCTLDASVAGTNGVLHVRNSGAGGGLSIGQAGDYGVRVWRSSYNGMEVDRAPLYGVRVDSCRAGLFVERSGENGVHVWASQGNGVRVDTAAIIGAWIQNAGWEGLLINRAGAEGIEIDRAQTTGVQVDTAATLNGFDAGLSGHHGFHADSCSWSGFAVDRAGFHGLHVNRANGHGALVQRARKDGLRVVKADSVGAQVDTAGQGFRVNSAQFGVVVGTASVDGIQITNAGDDGVQVSNANYALYTPGVNTTGVLISNAGSYGVYANSSNGAGGHFANNNNDNYALTAYNTTGAGAGVRGLYVQGHGYATGGWQSWLADGATGYALTGTEQQVIASGSAHLRDGSAEVAFPESFSRALATDAGLRVTVTPTARCAGVWVAAKDARGFRVESSDKSDAGFDWIAVGLKSAAEPAPAAPRIAGLK
jgi:hypothetical protein